MLMLLNFLICGSRFFHSFIVERKKDFLKESCFVRSWGIFPEFREEYLVLVTGFSIVLCQLGMLCQQPGHLMVFRPIRPGFFRAVNIRRWIICSFHTIRSSEIAIDLKYAAVLSDNKRAKFQEKDFDNVIIFLNDVIKFAEFGPKYNCP